MHPFAESDPLTPARAFAASWVDPLRRRCERVWTLVAGVVCVGLAAVAGPAWAQSDRTNSPWERVGLYEGRNLYIDPTTTRRSGSRLQVWVITDLREPNATARGRQYLSKKALLELDCSQRTMKVLQDTWYPRNMAQGEPVFQTEGASLGTFPIQSDSPGELIWKGACGRR